MKRLILLILFLFSILFSGYTQRNSVVVIPKIGVGYADKTTCFTFGSNIGYQYSNNRISLAFLLGAKKRQEYSNGDYKDLIIGNATLTHSKIYKKGLFSIVRDLGFGFVTGQWVESPDNNGKGIQFGLGLTFGCGIEYSPINPLLIKMSYNQAVLFKDFSGNGAILIGLGYKFYKY